MIDTLIKLFITVTCSIGQPIDDWPSYAASVDLARLSMSVRIASPAQGVRWLWVFDDKVLFLTNPDSQHGYCARSL